jgi:hypothetical protein
MAWSLSRISGRLAATVPICGLLFSAPQALGQSGSDALSSDSGSPFLIAVTGFGGAHLYAMDDLDQALKLVNEEVDPGGLQGVSYDEISAGASWAAGAQLVFKDRWLLRGEHERYYGSSQVGGSTASAEVSAELAGWLITAGFDFVKSPTLRFGIAGGIGLYSSRFAQIFAEDEQEVDRLDFEGDDTGYHSYAFCEFKLTPRIYANALSGYRFAKIESFDVVGLDDLVIPPGEAEQRFRVPIAEAVDVGGATVERLKGGGDQLDWSGLMLRVGLTFYLTPPS